MAGAFAYPGLAWFTRRMADTTAPARTESIYVLRGDRALSFTRYLDGDTALCYDAVAMRAVEVPVAEIDRPQGGQRVKLTPAQREVALYRFHDVATEHEDFGAVLEGDVLVLTDPAEAVDTLDNAIELCDDAAADGIPGRRREAATTRRLRAKVLAAIRG